MRTILICVCLFAIALITFNCSQEDGAQAPTILENDFAVLNDLEGSPVLDLGKYYSFADGPVVGYTALEWINTQNGTGTHVWLLDQMLIGDFVTWLGWIPFGLAFDVDGTMYISQNIISFDPSLVASQLARVDSETGEITAIGDPVPFCTSGPDIDACGNFYVCGFQVEALGYVWGNSSLWRVDKETGEYIEVGNTGHTNWMDLAFDSDGTLWGTFDNEIYTIDTGTGASTFVTEVHGVPNADPPDKMEIMSIAFDKHDILYGTAMTVYYIDPNGSPVMRIDTETGEGTLIGYTQQPYNHGGDMMPTKVRVCHRKGNGNYNDITVSLEALADHVAHGDIVPGTDGHDCGCPADGLKFEQN